MASIHMRARRQSARQPPHANQGALSASDRRIGRVAGVCLGHATVRIRRMLLAWWIRSNRRGSRGGKIVEQIGLRSRGGAISPNDLGHPEGLGCVEIPREPGQPDIAQAPIAQRRWIFASNAMAAGRIQVQELPRIRQYPTHDHLPVRTINITASAGKECDPQHRSALFGGGREPMRTTSAPLGPGVVGLKFLRSAARAHRNFRSKKPRQNYKFAGVLFDSEVR
jgi:hypothetical protein